MKKLMILGVALAVFGMSGSVAFADDHGERKGKMFKEADANGDGTISKEEFKAHHAKKAENWFGKLDQDGNGEVTTDEAKQGRKKVRERLEKRKERRGGAAE